MNIRAILNTTAGLSMHALLLLLATGSWAQADVVGMSSSKPGTLDKERMRHMTATVSAVDQKARTVTLTQDDGSALDLAVGDDVKRLNEVKVGDRLEVDYLAALSLELREATEEEMKTPLKVVEQQDRADMSTSPAAAAVRSTRAVVTLEGMSRWLNVITVLGPRGNYFVLEVEPGSIKWESLRIGQTMVATYTEALVMAIEPAEKEK